MDHVLLDLLAMQDFALMFVLILNVVSVFWMLELIVDLVLLDLHAQQDFALILV